MGNSFFELHVLNSHASTRTQAFIWMPFNIHTTYIGQYHLFRFGWSRLFIITNRLRDWTPAVFYVYAINAFF